MKNIKPLKNVSWDLDYYNSIDIRKVCEVLGIKVYRGGKILCPCHDDHSPSAVISTRGRYKNTWHCFVCNTGGNNISLVLAVKYGISPTDYFTDTTKYKEEFKNSVYFLEENFPGGMEYIDKSLSFEQNKKEIKVPQIPAFIYKKIGIPARTYLDAKENDYDSAISNAELVVDRFNDYETSLRDFGNVIFSVFPSLLQVDGAVSAVNFDTRKELEEIQKYKKMAEDHLERLYEAEPEWKIDLQNPPKDFAKYM